MSHTGPPSRPPRSWLRRRRRRPLQSVGGRRGTGLIELVIALTLLAILLGLGLRGGVMLRDRWATQGAREALKQAVREARSRAVARGGATLILDAERAEVWLEAGGDSLRHLRMGVEFGVDVDLGTTAEARLVFDAAGIGRMASRTIELRRGSARERVVVSAYGRVR